jgi:hypothetical protein
MQHSCVEFVCQFVCLLRVPAVFVGWPVRGGVDAGALFSGSTLEEEDVDACWGGGGATGGLGGSEAYRSSLGMLLEE